MLPLKAKTGSHGDNTNCAHTVIAHFEGHAKAGHAKLPEGVEGHRATLLTHGYCRATAQRQHTADLDCGLSHRAGARQEQQRASGHYVAQRRESL